MQPPHSPQIASVDTKNYAALLDMLRHGFERALIVEALQKDIDRRNRPADEADDADAKAPAEPASDWTGSAEEWKQVIEEYRRPVDLGQFFNRKR